MGFFFADNAIPLAKPPAARVAKKTRAQIEASHERGCGECPLQDTWSRISSPRMPISGNPEGDILVLGEAPGEEEDIQGEVFIGKTGKFLRRQLPHRYIDRLAFSNAVRCRPPGNRNPTGLELHCCSVHLENDARDSNFKAVLLVGGIPLSKFITEAPITQMHGVRFPVEIGEQVLWAYPVFHPSFVERMGGDNSSYFPPFASDLRRFFKEVDKWRKPTIERVTASDVVVVNNESDARGLIDQMEGTLGFDIETSQLKPYMPGGRIITASFSDGKTTAAFPVEHPASSNSWALPLILETTDRRRWVGHQSQFEFTWLVASAERLGVDWDSREGFDDSMALGRLYHARPSLLGLDILTRIVLGANVKKLTQVEARRIMDYPLEEVLPYNGLDAWGSRRILDRLGGRVNEYNYENLIRRAQSVARMELMGLQTDRARALELREKWQKIEFECRAEAENIYEVKSFVRDRQKEFNIGSNADVAAALVEYGKIELPKTKSEKSVSTDDDALRPHADTNPLARCTLNYREARKHLSTYIEPVLHVEEANIDGLLHPSYTTMRTATLRLSSGRGDDEKHEGDTNIQNWPKRRHREIRGMVVAPPGHVIMACDSGQIQARIYGMATRDENLCRSFIEKEDIHSYWLNRALYLYPDYLQRLADQTNESNEAKIRKAGRDTIKSDFTFASFFGTTAKNCAERTRIPFIIMQQLLDEFWGRYPRAYKWLKAQRASYRETGGVTTLTGQPRFGIMTGNEPIITPIQAGEAEFMLAAQCDLSERAVAERDMYLHPRINVHDDLTFIVPDQDDKIEEYMGIIAEAMTRVRFIWQIVPLTVEIKIGYRWDDLEEIAVIEGDYLH